LLLKSWSWLFEFQAPRCSGDHHESWRVMKIHQYCPIGQYSLWYPKCAPAVSTLSVFIFAWLHRHASWWINRMMYILCLLRAMPKIHALMAVHTLHKYLELESSSFAWKSVEPSWICIKAMCAVPVPVGLEKTGTYVCSRVDARSTNPGSPSFFSNDFAMDYVNRMLANWIYLGESTHIGHFHPCLLRKANRSAIFGIQFPY
jgi:hypothetical protein